MYDSKTFEILKIAKFAIPKNTKVYLVGGAVRNALYFKIFNEKLPQRDYDILLIGNKEKFVKNLRSHGFVYGKIKRKNEIVLKKKKIPKPRHEFNDYVFLDIHTSDEKNILKNLKENSNFTINGFALSLKDIDSKNWHKKVISLSRAMQDLKNKKLRVNVIVHPANLFACFRFISKGFEPPSKKEIKELLVTLGSLEKWRYKKNIRKLFDYVGGEKEAKKLAKKLGIKENIFDFKTIQKLRVQN
jgi:tRNA nucleotidyltransferase/poly(A) polymerase